MKKEHAANLRDFVVLVQRALQEASSRGRVVAGQGSHRPAEGVARQPMPIDKGVGPRQQVKSGTAGKSAR